MHPRPPDPPLVLPVVVRRRTSTRVGLSVLGTLFGTGTAVLVWLTATGRAQPAGLGTLLGVGSLGLVAWLVVVHVILHRVVIAPDHVAARGLTGRVVLPLAGLLRVERQGFAQRAIAPFPFLRRTGYSRVVVGRTARGRVRRVVLSAAWCDTTEADRALDALLRQLPWLDADVQGTDLPFLRWYDQPLGRVRRRPAPGPTDHRGWGDPGYRPPPR